MKLFQRKSVALTILGVWSLVMMGLSLPVTSSLASGSEPGSDSGSDQNVPPSAVLVSPAEGVLFEAPADVMISVVASDPDGWIQSIQFGANGDVIGEMSYDPLVRRLTNTYKLRWMGVAAGDYLLTALVTDNEGAQTLTDPVTIRVLDPSRIPVVTVKVTDDTATEQSEFVDSIPDTGEIQILRTGPVDDSLTVFYRVLGTAVNGVDYQELKGEVTIEAGEAAAVLPVIALDDQEVERDETVVLELLQLDWAADGEYASGQYLVGRPGHGVVAIKDDEPRPNDPPTVAIINPPAGALLPSFHDIIVLAEAHDPDGWVESVKFFLNGELLGVAPGTPPTDEVIPLTRELERPDWLPQGLFEVLWNNPQPGSFELKAVAVDNLGLESPPDLIEVTIFEIPEQPVVTVVASDPRASEDPLDLSADPLPDPGTFTLHRTGEVDFALEVFFTLRGSASNGLDYEEISTSAIIPIGETSVDVVVQPIDDDEPERLEHVVLVVLPPACIEIFPPPRECYLVGKPNQAAVAIQDNDGLPNQAPRVRMIRPHDGQVFFGPRDLTLSAAAWDVDGAIAWVEFFEGDNSVGRVTDPDPNPLSPVVEEGAPTCPEWCVPRYSLAWPDVAPGNYTLTAVATDNLGLAMSSTPVNIKVLAEQFPPVVNVVAIDAEAAEPDVFPVPTDGANAPVPPIDTAAFEFSRTGDLSQPLTVVYHVRGSADNGIDYEEIPDLITFPEGEAKAYVTIVPLHDELPEGTETVVLQLVPVQCRETDYSPVDSGHWPPYLVGPNSAARAFILDNDAPPNIPPRVRITRPIDGQVFVNPDAVEIRAMTLDPDGWVPRVEFYANGQHIGTSEIVFVREPDPGEPLPHSILWEDVPAGDFELIAKAFDNEDAETLSEPVNIIVVRPQVMPVVTVRTTDPVGSETGMLTVIDPAVFTIHRTGSTDRPLTVWYALGGSAENGVDYLELSGEVEIPVGASAVEVEVIPVNDTIEEDLENVVIELVPVPCPAIEPPPPGCYIVGRPDRAVAVIRDAASPGNLAPRVEIVRPIEGQVYQSPATVNIVAQAKDRDGWVALVEFFANDEKIGEESRQFFAEPPPGEVQTFRFKWSDVPPGEYALNVRATDNQGAVSEWPEPVGIVVVPEQEPPTVALFVTDPLARERPVGGHINTATFKIRRSGPTENPLTVFYEIQGSAENGVDYTHVPGHTTIPAGSRWARITITPIDDQIAEGVETVKLTLTESPAASPMPPYRVSSHFRRAVAVILDDDLGAPGPDGRPEGMFHARLEAESGEAYRVEASDDLVHWRILADRLAEDGQVHHIDPDSPGLEYRFYRVRPVIPEVLTEEP